jgi:hypothetical protein
MRGRVAWVSTGTALRDLIPRFRGDENALRHQLDKLMVPTVPLGGTALHRAMDIVLAFGIEGVCPVCLEPIFGDKRPTYCCEACRKLGVEAMSARCATVEVTIPVAEASISPLLFASLRRHARANGLTVTESLRVALLVGAKVIVDGDQQP